MSEHRTERVIEGAARPEWSRLPVAAVVLVSFLLAATVGMASAASPWLPDDGTRSSPPRIVGALLPVALAGGLCILLGLIWVQTPRRAKAATKRKPGGSAGVTTEVGSGLRAGSLVVIGGTLVVILLVIAFWFLLEQGNVAQPPPELGTTVGDTSALPPVEPAGSASPAFDRFILGLIASIAVVLPLALVARRRLWRARPEHDQEEDGVPQAVVRAVGDSIDQIERDEDARRAIIRAYAQMEHAFGDAGIPRRPYEAPFEYLGRALRGVRVSAPAAGRLAALFERARFSEHEVGPETKHEAIGVLREVERQLQGPPS